ncbi:MAG: calcium/sodium antiporter [Desulfobacterales bacterium]|nr:calcium/sodium antiporter [Desulfobacterales bacterium]
MLIHFLILILGFTLLIGGGDLLVRGASVIASNLGIPTLIIGLTVVAFGTSAPELTVNILAAVNGNTGISFGNIIGSNIANIGLVIGVAALVKPLTVKGDIIKREIPVMTLASLMALIAGIDLLLRNSANTFDRSDGLTSLLFFSIFMYYTVRNVFKNRKKEDALLDQVDKPKITKKSTLLSLIFFAAGLVFLIYGGKIAVDSAVKIAEALTVPKSIIGLTIVAIGTSLPELITTVIATYRGETDLAIGSVVGSNIFNLLLVNGACSTITNINVPAYGYFDLIMMTFLSLLLLPLCADKKIDRWEGFMLVSLYFSYNIWRVFF